LTDRHVLSSHEYEKSALHISSVSMHANEFIFLSTFLRKAVSLVKGVIFMSALKVGEWSASISGYVNPRRGGLLVTIEYEGPNISVGGGGRGLEQTSWGTH
jgi:hypothetical protein